MHTQHDLFWQKYNAEPAAEKQKEMLKNYMLSLPKNELDDFIFSNLTIIKHGIANIDLMSEAGKKSIEIELLKIENILKKKQSKKAA